jgi:uncharacterized protein YjbJ (UPF0337 family)
MDRYLAPLLLAIGLSTPLVMSADDRDHAKRYYDKSHRDYHEWNDNEARSYNLYLGEKHIQVHAWTKAPAREQQDYWNWRHDHPDHQ